MPEMPGGQGMGYGQAEEEELVKDAIKKAIKDGTFHIAPMRDENVSEILSMIDDLS